MCARTRSLTHTYIQTDKCIASNMKRARHIRYRRCRRCHRHHHFRLAVQTPIDSFKELFESKARTILLETVYFFFCVQQIQYFWNVSFGWCDGYGRWCMVWDDSMMWQSRLWCNVLGSVEFNLTVWASLTNVICVCVCVCLFVCVVCFSPFRFFYRVFHGIFSPSSHPSRLVVVFFATTIHISSAKSCVIWAVFHFRYCHCNTVFFMDKNIESALYHILNAEIKDKLVSAWKNRHTLMHSSTFTHRIVSLYKYILCSLFNVYCLLVDMYSKYQIYTIQNTPFYRCVRCARRIVRIKKKKKKE